jgi:hypothetical protein
VRIVCVDDIWPELPDHATEAPRGGQVDFGARRNRNQLEPLAGAPPQLAVGVRDESGPLADFAESINGQQHLVLTTAP